MSTELSEFGESAMTDPRERERRRRVEVAADLVASSYLRGEFRLSNGTASSYYFDKYLFETKPTILRRVAEMLAERIPHSTDRLAGCEGGGVALVAAVSLATGIPFVIVRRPDHDGEPLRGELHAEERVVVVADVVDSGSQVLGAATQLRDRQAEVVGVVAVIDREAGGARALAAAGLHYDPLLTLSELVP